MATFGNVTTGASSPATTVLVTNVGDQPSGAVMVAVSGTAASSFQVQGSTCTGALGPMGTCQFGVVFSPTATGALAAAVDVSGMPGGSRSIAVSGQGAFPAALSINPTTFDFRGVGLGSSSTPQVFTITNTGGSPTGVPGVAVTGPDGAMFTVLGTTCTAVLAPAAPCTVTVLFVPTTTGARTATLEVSAMPGGRATAALSATGETSATLSATPSPGVFNDTASGGMGNSITFTVTNSGQTTTAPLGVSIVGAAPADFVLGMNTCQGTAVMGGQTCTVAVQFNPVGTGTRNALLTVSGMGAVPATVVLTGRGLFPAQLRLSTMSANFGSVATGTNATLVIGVSNTGEAPTSFPTFTATPNPEFATGSNTCGVSIGPGAMCSVTLVFAPGSLGPRTGNFTAGATTGGMVSASLQGAGVAPGALAITPNTQGFGSFPIGQAGGSRTFTVTNTGGSALTSPTLSLGGNAATSFSIGATSTCGPPAVLASGAFCNAVVAFTPQNAGALSAFLTATSGANTAQATLSGTGLNPAQLRITPAGATFPSTVVGSSFDQPFTVTNSGDVVSGTVSITRSGPDAAQWAVNASTCTGPLAPQATCTFRLTYTPTSPSMGHSANVTASASPGSMATAPVTGTAISAAALTLLPASGSSAAYGNVLLNGTSTMNFTVTNTGQQASGPLSLSLSGPNAAQWQVGTGTSACQLGQPLPGGASCTTPVRFTATAASGNGLKTATLTASAMPGSLQTQALTATVQNPATLSPTSTTNAFNDVSVGNSSSKYTWTITNMGDVATSALTFVNTNATSFPVTSNTCTGTLLPPMGSCSVILGFTPTTAGATSAALTVSATTGGSVSLTATGNGQWLVTVTPPTNAGTRVQTTDGRINCPGTCSAGYNNTTSVSFQALTNNGSGFHFEGWTAPSPCNADGTGAKCVSTITSNTTATAVFSPIDANLVFVSSAFYRADLGGVGPYDTACNTLATAAGINNVAGNAFRAWISTASSAANARITATGGFRRMDSTIFAASKLALQLGFVRAPLFLDEFGRRVTNGLSTWTGTDTAGNHRASQDCAGWTSASAVVFLDRGRVEGGPGLFTAGTGGHTCSNTTTRISCFQSTSSVNLAADPIPMGGKVAFVAPPWGVAGGLAGADAHCNANKPTGFDTAAYVYRAFMATATASAASRLPVGTSYYSPSGTFIGTSDALKNTTDTNRLANLNTGLWQQNGTVYIAGDAASAWTGAGCSGNCIGTNVTTCSNWTSNGALANALVGRVASAGSDFFDGFGPSACNAMRHVYCFQQ